MSKQIDLKDREHYLSTYAAQELTAMEEAIQEKEKQMNDLAMGIARLSDSNVPEVVTVLRGFLSNYSKVKHTMEQDLKTFVDNLNTAKV